ncbi:UNVERIFIED_CONTAM: hypothetical protein Sradi_3444500 [Sesamum radiatum]|uniref:Legume lectin domain-containing protein n=1 Tax=Sesamum radiatum TaxID=300843 RepID=A0AAW2R6R9_SESRA
MAAVSSPRYLLAFFLLNLYLKVLDADPNLTFSFKNFGKDSNFESQFALYGDAEVASDGMSVQMADSGVSTAGRVICKKPMNLVEGNSRNVVSFSNYFVFSMSKENGDGLSFVMLPSGFPLNVFDVEKKLQAWIDYEASSKRFEVRLSKFGDNRPVDPLLSYPIDLSQMWNEEDVTVGLSSSSGNSSQKCNIYSWSFKSRTVPQWMHSEPMDPEDVVENAEELKVPKKSNCALRILAALIFGTVCGALGAFFVLFLWTIFGNRRPVVPEEFAVQSKEFEYKKFNVSVDKTIEDGKN